MRLEDLSLIGNCQLAALVRTDGAIVWCCMPRFDSEPVFGSLLDPDAGGFALGPADGSTGRQHYVDNTNVLATVFETPDGAFRVLDFAPRFHSEIMERAFSERLHAIACAYGGHGTDASLLQMATLRFLPATDPRLEATIAVIRRDLDRGGWLHRYATDDGFGKPTVAFVICTFWLVGALATIGRRAEAAGILEHALAALSPTGLLAEDWDPSERRLWGNFPQAYSHVGLIDAAFAASQPWSEVL